MAFMTNVTLDENTDMQARAYLDMHCCKGTPSKVSHPSDWTQHARFKLPQCDSYNPIAFAFIIGLDPNLHGKGKIELDDVTMALFLTYNENSDDASEPSCAPVQEDSSRTHMPAQNSGESASFQQLQNSLQMTRKNKNGGAFTLNRCETIDHQPSKPQRSQGSTGTFPSQILIPFAIQGTSQCTLSVRIQPNPQPPSPCTQQIVLLLNRHFWIMCQTSCV
eukprot:13121234-Ditylum_brightwellii.AAC.1